MSLEGADEMGDCRGVTFCLEAIKKGAMTPYFVGVPGFERVRYRALSFIKE